MAGGPRLENPMDSSNEKYVRRMLGMEVASRREAGEKPLPKKVVALIDKAEALYLKCSRMVEFPMSELATMVAIGLAEEDKGKSEGTVPAKRGRPVAAKG